MHASTFSTPHLLVPNELFELLEVVTSRTRGVEVVLPEEVRPLVAPLLHALDPLRVPRVKVGRADLGDVHPKVAVDSRALDAHKDSKVPRGPSRPCDERTYEGRDRRCEQRRRRS